MFVEIEGLVTNVIAFLRVMFHSCRKNNLACAPCYSTLLYYPGKGGHATLTAVGRPVWQRAVSDVSPILEAEQKKSKGTDLDENFCIESARLPEL